MKLNKTQQAKHDEAVRFKVVDPVTGRRHCRWCMTVTTETGEYLCPQCGRWQHEKAFPDGVPGVSQAEHECVNDGCPTHQNGDVLLFAHDATDPRCPTCGRPAPEVAD